MVRNGSLKKGRRVLDSDTHVIETPDVWTSRLPKAWGDQVMHMEFDPEQGIDVWKIGSDQVARGWHNAWYRAKVEDLAQRHTPPTQDHVDPSCYDPKARLEVMDLWGIETAVLYPNAAGFSLEPFLKHPDPEVSAAHISAYNDFLLEEWVAAAPGRFIPMACVSYWDIPRAVKEIHRIAGKGFGGIVTTGAPQLHDQPWLRDTHWDPYWAAAQEVGLPFAFHVANGDTTPLLAKELLAIEPHDITETRAGTTICLENAMQTTDLILSGVLGRFPDLKFVISESGMGWVPFVLEACDQRFKRQNIRLPEFDGLLPSELFRRQVRVNCFYERVEQWHVDRIGVETLMFQTDIPHPTGFYYDGSDDFFGDSVTPALSGLPDDVLDKILWENGAALYAHAFKEQGALV